MTLLRSRRSRSGASLMQPSRSSHDWGSLFIDRVETSDTMLFNSATWLATAAWYLATYLRDFDVVISTSKSGVISSRRCLALLPRFFAFIVSLPISFFASHIQTTCELISCVESLKRYADQRDQICGFLRTLAMDSLHYRLLFPPKERFTSKASCVHSADLQDGSAPLFDDDEGWSRAKDYILKLSLQHAAASWLREISSLS